jgi:RimJ/RimL family protein N-acetyltransferase
MVNIRLIHERDAEAFLQLRKQIADETPFLLRDSNEITLSIAEQREQIQRVHAQDRHIILIAEHEGSLLGFLMGIRGVPKRTQHVLTVVVGIRQSSVRRGIGTQLFSEMERWAINHGIHRLELQALLTNQVAIAFYTKQNFRIEGVMKHAQYIEGQYIDAYFMAKILPL